MADLFEAPDSVLPPPVPAEPAYDGPRCPKSGRPLKCRCGKWALFGSHVDFRNGKVGRWDCFDCAPAMVRRGTPLPQREPHL